jgi:protoporphyrinogen oxidase
VWPQLEKAKFKTYWQAVKKLKGPKARSVSFKNGMQELIDALARSIKGTIHLNYSAPFEMRPNTILCTDAHTSADLLEGSWREGQELLRSISYLPITSVTIHSTQRMSWSQKGFGVLFPRGGEIMSLGCLFNHSIFPNRVKGEAASSLTFILNETDKPMPCVQRDLEALEWTFFPLQEKVFTYPLGLPVYNEARWSAIQALHAHPSIPVGLAIFGNYVAGISLRDLIETASSFARDLGVE